MIVKDLTEFQSEDGKISFVGVLRATTKHGFSWKRKRGYQEDFLSSIQNLLDNKCVVLRSLTLPREENPIPLVLISSLGLSVINPQKMEGVFQARDDTWNAIDRTGNLVAAEPNLVQETQSYAGAVQGYLKSHNVQDVPVESVLAFVSAGTHVDTKHSVVRVLSFDAIKNFARKISASQLILDQKEKEQLVQLLSKPRPPSYSTPYPEREDSPSSASAPRVDAAQSKTLESLNKITKKLNFSKRQWLLLGGMLLFQVILLIIFILIIIFL
ncbi:MAG: hypothetical protein U9O54_01610 [Chloroflexota bacterium]|nr:hypothetical protein [Chloroflexota bacterium]